MNFIHLHLITNHAPIFGSLFGFIVLTYGLFSRNRPVQHTGYVTLIGSTLVAIIALISGGRAEKLLKGVEGFSHDLIEHHEHASALAFWCHIGLGLLAILGLLANIKYHDKRRGIGWLVAVGALAVFILMARAGSTGGDIKHPEKVNTPYPILEPHDD